ncbi:MAG TPA: hypothetical protein VK439_04700 [Rubrivivax sp.]|nr:hypothetical protein [Rubrivivax sp.]
MTVRALSALSASTAFGALRGRGRLAFFSLLSLIVALLAWATLAPVQPVSREQLFEIPKGTFARRMAGDKVDILPGTIRLTLGADDVLLLRNLDDVPQVFGPALIMPGQSFRLPFEAASTYSFACSAHASGQMSVVVEPALTPGWPTLRWRLRRWQLHLPS